MSVSNTKQASRSLGSALFGSKLDTDDLHPSRQKLLNQMARDPWTFVTAVDPITQEPIVWTRNEKSSRGEDPFPNKDYLQWLFYYLRTEPVVIVPKSRQMIITTGMLVLTLWEIMFLQSWRAILSKVTEDDAEELIENKVRYTYRKLPDWLRKSRRLTPSPLGRATCLETGGYILAAAQNVADREARGGTANRLIIDEAAYQDFTRQIVEAGQPMTQHLVLVSSPNSSYPGGRFMRSICFDDEP